MKARDIIARLRSLADPVRASGSQRFFKSGAGDYGSGDRFLGISMPELRQQVKATKPLPLEICVELLSSPYHEVRMYALLMMVELFKSRDPHQKTSVYRAYLANRQGINNWDLVDCACYKILGPYLAARSHAPLFQLAESTRLWDRRIAIVSTYHFIRKGAFQTTLELAQLLLADREDLIHKAVGWMLKEIGKRDLKVLDLFLQAHYRAMPRVMLRTAIEKLPRHKRDAYLKGHV